MTDKDTLLEFPCDFPIKAFGRADSNFPESVIDIIKRHAPNTPPESVTLRPSSGGKYSAVTVTIYAESKQQIDTIYLELTKNPDVIMAL